MQQLAKSLTTIANNKIMIVNTTDDGWNCVPELKEAVYHIELMKHDIYEIKTCVRASALDRVVKEMKLHLKNAIDCLDEINTELSYKTIVDEE